MSAETAHTISPSSEEAWRLAGHYLNRLSHDLPEQWRLHDHEASVPRAGVVAAHRERQRRAGRVVAAAVRHRGDPGCAAREMYLTSDGSDSVPASGPLPAFARHEGLGYFEYRTHPHHDGWACDVDPVSVTWISTALALYGGYMRINWFDMGGADSMAAGHSL